VSDLDRRGGIDADPNLLAASAARGEAGAWADLVTATADAVWSVARSGELSREDAALVSALSWLRLRDRIRDELYPESVVTWLTVTAHREALRLEAIRRGERGRPTGRVDLGGPPPAGVAPTPDGPSDDEVYRAFEALPHRCRALLRLMTVGDHLRYREISEALDIPPGSIGPTRARCLAALARHLSAT